MTAAITGWAWRTPLGATIAGVMDRLAGGDRAATEALCFDTSSYAVKLGAPVPGSPRPSPHRKFLRRMGLFAIEAANEAMAAAGTKPGPRLGLFAAYGGLRAHWNEMMPALAAQQPDGSGSWERGFKSLHPYWMLRHLSNNAHALLAADAGAKGEGLTLAGANAGAQAISCAIRALNEGTLDAAVVVAYDSLLEPETLVELGARGSATGARLAHLAAPYCAAASGFVPGEAAAAIVLERREQAGSRALAWIAAADGADGSPGAPGIETLMRVAKRAGRGGAVVDGAAQGVPAYDAAECRMLATLCEGGAALSAIAAATGQLGAAMAVVQAIALAESLRRGMLPPIAGLAEPGGTASSLGVRPLTCAETTRSRTALALCAGAPGLAGAMRIEVP